jgi:peptidoglycan/xylan/chitin deacetylase (PgdA/CDA1 family)
MLITLLYHRINRLEYGNLLPIMKDHLHFLSQNYNIVLPGEKLSKGINICLTFDDAFFDIYHYLFPLFKKLKIKAVIGAPTCFILHKTDVRDKIRLSLDSDTAMKGNFYRSHSPFCTWEELIEMSKSGYIKIASHSHSHKNLLEKNIDLKKEINGSKQIIENILQTKIDTFIYPYGKFDSEIHDYVCKHYSYIMRIGTALNFSWQNKNRLIYRISADGLIEKNDPLKLRNFFKYFSSYFLNTVRKK